MIGVVAKSHIGGRVVTSGQFTRGVVRTLRAMDRAAKQAERQRLARQQVQQRKNLLDESARLAAEFETIMGALTGAHRISFSRRDWTTTATREFLPKPERQDGEERAAERILATYRPGWFTRVFGREGKARQSLADNVHKARQRDAAAHTARLSAAEAENTRTLAARRVLDRDPNALVAALEEHSQLGNLPFAIEGLGASFINQRVIAIVDGLDLDSIPKQTVTMLKSGQASTKTITVGKRHELHREAICSAAVRVAIEFLGTLPLEQVEVLMRTNILDRGSGHISAQPILHVRVAAQALQALNLQRTEASAVVERLGGHMDWGKRDGFRAISAAAHGVDLED